MSTNGHELRNDRWLGGVWAMWHTAFVFLVVVVLFNLAADHAPWTAYALLMVVCAAYVGPLPPAMRCQNQRSGVLYLVVVVPATLALGYVDADALIILYAVFPHVFGVLEDMRLRLLVIGGLAAGSMAVAMRHESPGAAVVNVGAALVVSLMIGMFTQVLLREAQRRGELITQLEAVRADLDRAHHEAGVMAERQRLSHEIHDTLAQGFTSLLMLIQAADSTVENDPDTTHERLALAERTARENLAEARSLVAALAPAPLQSAPLDTALERITARAGQELGIGTAVTVHGTPRELSADVQVVLLRAAQEALSNVRKHAAASTVQLRLSYRRHSVLLEVQDDGAGFTAGADDRSFGLRAMRSRVEQVSGTLDVDSAPGAGTTVRVEIP
jgi:signal transduction histidine kinase